VVLFHLCLLVAIDPMLPLRYAALLGRLPGKAYLMKTTGKRQRLAIGSLRCRPAGHDKSQPDGRARPCCEDSGCLAQSDGWITHNAKWMAAVAQNQVITFAVVV
jgi:hypothetical protein